MNVKYNKYKAGFAALLTAGVTLTGVAVAAPTDTFAITRKNLANTAAFTVTQTIAPKGGDRFQRVYKVEVKGTKARADFEDPQAGTVRYLANEKGIFSFLPASNTAVKQNIKGGVEEALKLVFSQTREQMAGAKKIGTATVSGQPTTVYRGASGTTIYWGNRPGYRLPVKMVQTNAGGTTTVAVSDIRLNVAIPDARFALPAGTQIMDGASGAGGGVVPGVR
jgi:outer membrane lipoprotein-sorting protein